MKKAILFVVLLAICSASINKALVVVSFAINQDMIAQELCENRDQPQKHCNGKCYLKKEIAKGETKDSKNLPFPLSQLFEDFVWISFSNFTSTPSNYLVDLKTKYNPSLESKYTICYLNKIAHPPCRS